MDDTNPDVERALDALLDRERAVVLSGRLDQLSQLVPEKEALLERLACSGLSATSEPGRLMNKAVRNQELLENALKGLRSVANRIATLRQMSRSFDTYDQSGRRARILVRRENNVEHRA